MAYVDLICVTKDHPQLLHGFLSSLKLSGVEIADLCRVIVVNNGTEESLSRFEQETSWFKIVQAKENLGWEGGLALGMTHTTAPIVGLCNDDIFLPPQNNKWLRRLLAHFRDPAVGAVGPCSNFVMGCQNMTWAPSGGYMQDNHFWAVPYLIGFFVLYRRAALEAVGGIDLTMPGADDLHRGMQFQQAGWTQIADRSVFVYHHGAQTGTAEHGAFWNSEAHLHPLHTALIQRHGFLNYFRCVSGQPTQYLPPQTEVGVGGSEEAVMMGYLPAGATILNVGCGHLPFVPGAIGVDLHAKGEAVPQLGHQASQADVAADLNRPLPFETGTVDGIVAKHILEHLVDTLGVLRDWHRVLRQGGRVIIAVPDERKVQGVAMNPEHCHAFTVESLTTLAEAAGFTTVGIGDPKNGISFVYCGERNGSV